jgi:predicted nucleic-acid-binding protein
MTGIDTNILVRFLVADDEAQTQSVYRLFKEAETKKNSFFISLPTNSCTAR